MLVYKNVTDVTQCYFAVTEKKAPYGIVRALFGLNVIMLLILLYIYKIHTYSILPTNFGNFSNIVTLAKKGSYSYHRGPFFRYWQNNIFD